MSQLRWFDLDVMDCTMPVSAHHLPATVSEPLSQDEVSRHRAVVGARWTSIKFARSPGGWNNFGSRGWQNGWWTASRLPRLRRDSFGPCCRRPH